MSVPKILGIGRLTKCALFLFSVITSSVFAENTSREWTSLDGRVLTARVLQIDTEKETIELERDDGLTFTLSWEQLSKSDVSWISEYLEKQRPKASDQNPPELPQEFELKDVPMVVQKGNFCVPASAAMIAGFHGLETDQDEVAQLSSEASASNQGTYPIDMLLAMQKLGFQGEQQHWKDKEDFFETALPAIRQALVATGPIYISFRKGVFGAMGHGCVIIGYNDRREEMTFHNPWGDVFVKSYTAVGYDGHGVVYIDPPQPAPIADEAFIKTIRGEIPVFEGSILTITKRLIQAELAHNLVWCSRRDARDDKKFARDTARSDGRKILELAFERNPAVIIPLSPSGKTQAVYFVTRPPNGGSNFQVYEITEKGWSEPELKTLGSLTRNWSTVFEVPEIDHPVWELPMIELGKLDF
ncbi:MAG: papain-like cysteine protease family protein [Opitutaceae bacterium]